MGNTDQQRHAGDIQHNPDNGYRVVASFPARERKTGIPYPEFADFQ